MEVKFDKEKVDKIIEKMQKISEVNAEYAKVISKYTLSDKEVEYLSMLSSTLSKREKALGKLSNTMESLMKDWDSYTTPVVEKSIEEKIDTPVTPVNPVNIPIATPSAPIINTTTTPASNDAPVFVINE